MTLVLASSWWSLVIRGLVAIMVGALTVFWPTITVEALVLLFGAYALIDGIVNIAGAWRASRTHERWGALLFEGLVGVAAAVVTIFWPAITAIALVYVVAAWALVTGVFAVMAAVRLRRYIAGELLLALAGITSILFGMLLIIAPLAGAVALALWFGVYAVISGTLLVALGLRLRSRVRTLTTGDSMLATPH